MYFPTDCKSVKTLARAGKKKATSARQVDARAWTCVFARSDGPSPAVELVPAHLGEEMIGVVEVGNGTKLTRQQWEMNGLVDEQAKLAAKCGRRPGEETREYLKLMKRVAELACWIGRATFAANNGSEDPRRDTGASREGRRRTGAGEEGKKASRGAGRGVRKTARPPQLGGHELRERDGGWACVVCWRVSRVWDTVAAERCSGSVAGFWARRAMELGGHGGSDGAGHVRAANGEVVWCIRCGSYAIKWAVGLAGPCRGAPENPSQTRVLARLKAGRHPRTNATMEGPTKFEVHGMGLGAVGAGLVDECGGNLVAVQGRSTVGYLRRPGGGQPIRERSVLEEGGLGIMGLAKEGGPREEFLQRRRLMRLTAADYVGGGGESQARKRQRADEAREEDDRVVEGLVACWAAAMDAGVEATGGAAEEDVVAVVGRVEVDGAGVAAQETRKDLVARLRGEVAERRATAEAGVGSGTPSGAWQGEVLQRSKRRRMRVGG